MKNLRMPMVCLCIAISSACSFSQTTAPLNKPDYNKPKLFESLPEKITVAISDVELMIGKQTGEATGLTLDQSRQVSFTGTVISVSAPSANDSYRSVVIRSDNFSGARMQLIRAVKEDGSIAYEGRIISNQHGDAYLLRRDGNNLVFEKKGYYQLTNE